MVLSVIRKKLKMKHYKKLAIGVLILLMIVGATGVSASAPDAGSAQGQSALAPLLVVPGWEQVNSNGFGDPNAGEVSALEVFNSYIYAGTNNPITPGPDLDGARIFRSANGTTWAPVTDPGFGNAHDTAPTAVLDMVVFGSYIYASTGRSANAAKIFRSLTGASGTWAPVVNTGFSNPDNHDIPALAVYNGKIYAGVTNTETGVQIWSSFNGGGSINDWDPVPPTETGPAPSSLTGLAVFDGALYGAVQSEGPIQIWNTYSTDWAPVNSDGLGDANNTTAGGMAVFGGYLYVGVGNTTSGAKLYRTNDAATWNPVTVTGLNGAGNQKVEAVFVFQNQLYVSAYNATTGIQLWRSPDGTLWERANQDGFGDSHNPGTNGSNASANFQGLLYMGTSNVTDGGELWRTQPQRVYAPLLRR